MTDEELEARWQRKLAARRAVDEQMFGEFYALVEMLGGPYEVEPCGMRGELLRETMARYRGKRQAAWNDAI